MVNPVLMLTTWRCRRHSVNIAAFINDVDVSARIITRVVGWYINNSSNDSTRPFCDTSVHRRIINTTSAPRCRLFPERYTCVAGICGRPFKVCIGIMCVIKWTVFSGWNCPYGCLWINAILYCWVSVFMWRAQKRCRWPASPRCRLAPINAPLLRLANSPLAAAHRRSVCASRPGRTHRCTAIWRRCLRSPSQWTSKTREIASVHGYITCACSGLEPYVVRFGASASNLNHNVYMWSMHTGPVGPVAWTHSEALIYWKFIVACSWIFVKCNWNVVFLNEWMHHWINNICNLCHTCAYRKIYLLIEYKLISVTQQ